MEGPPDLIVEIVSDASVSRDTRRLPQAYYAVGVEEYWLAHARSGELLFQIYHRGPAAFEPATRDAEGFQPSAVFSCHFRLDGARNQQGDWTFDLRVRG